MCAGVGFLNNAGSSLGPGGLGGLIICLSLFLAFEVKALKSFRISTVVASLLVGTNERPLLSRSTCGLDNCTLERLTMLLVAHW